MTYNTVDVTAGIMTFPNDYDSKYRCNRVYLVRGLLFWFLCALDREHAQVLIDQAGVGAALYSAMEQTLMASTSETPGTYGGSFSSLGLMRFPSFI